MWRIHRPNSIRMIEEQNPVTDDQSDHWPGGPHQKWIRFPEEMEAICYASSPSEPSTWTARVRILWTGGCCLSFDRSLSTGDELLCRLESRGHPLTNVLQVRVSHIVQEDAETWYATCEFCRELTNRDCCVLL